MSYVYGISSNTFYLTIADRNVLTEIPADYQSIFVIECYLMIVVRLMGSFDLLVRYTLGLICLVMFGPYNIDQIKLDWYFLRT